MKSSIEQCLRIRFPEIYPYDLIAKEPDTELSNYKLLRYFGTYCFHHFGDSKTDEIIGVINHLYTTRNLFVQNAIENEFLTVLASGLGIDGLINRLNKIPVELWTIYIKVLLETERDKQKKSNKYEI